MGSLLDEILPREGSLDRDLVGNSQAAGEIVGKVSRKSELAAAFPYMRPRWPSLVRCFDDGRLALDNPAERALRGVAMRRSLCPSYSSHCQHWKLVFRRDATRASCSRNRGDHPFILQVVGTDLIRCARHNLFGGQHTVLDQPADAVVRNPKRRSGLGHR
jgi:transposase